MDIKKNRNINKNMGKNKSVNNSKKRKVILKDGSGGLNKKIGDLGENIATVFLEKRGFEIVDRNYRNKIGEIDIVAQKDGFYHIIEVKTLKIPTKIEFLKGKNIFDPDVSIIRDGERPEWLKPEINLTENKIRKVKAVALGYCMAFNLKEEVLKFMGICVSLYHTGSRVTKDNLISCKVKALPLFE